MRQKTARFYLDHSGVFIYSFYETKKEKERQPLHSSFFLSYTSVPAISGIMSHLQGPGTTDIYYDKRKFPVLQANSYKIFIKKTF